MYDLNSDGKIDMKDIATVARKFRKVCPKTEEAELGFTRLSVLAILSSNIDIGCTRHYPVHIKVMIKISS